MEKSIFVVDDAANIAKLAAKIMENLGVVNVKSFSDPRKALEEMKKMGGVSVLMTDITMPEIDGVMLANEAMLLNPGTIIIFFSGYNDLNDGEIIKGSFFLAKPFSIEEIEAKLVEAEVIAPPPVTQP